MKTYFVLLAASLGLVSAWPTQLTFNRNAAEVKPIRKLLGGDSSDVLPALPRWRKGIPGPPREIDMSDLTIAEILNGSLHQPPHSPDQGPPKYPPLQKFAFFVNLSNSSPFKDSIADEKAQVTLLAPDDFALTPPHRRDHEHGPPHHREGEHGPPHHHEGEHGPPHHHEGEHGPPHRGEGDHGPPRRGEDDHGPSHHGEGPHHPDLVNPRRHPMHSPHMLKSLVERAISVSDEEDDKRAERKEKILKIITLILRYHLIDSGSYEAIDLVNNATIASSLSDVRMRVEPHLFPYKHLTFNFFSRTRGPTIKAKNGYIHLLSEPLLPPLTPLEDLFVVPFIFSTLTSGLQKVDLDEVLSPWVHHHAENDEVAPVVSDLLDELVKEHQPVREFTVFAPSNRAFFSLGPKINAFLFSPFGRNVLKAILSYHIVPDVVFFSDFISDKSKVSFINEESVKELPERDDESLAEMIDAGLRRPLDKMLPGDGEIKVRHFMLTTLFNDTKLPVDLYESRRFGKGPVKRELWVGQQSEVAGSRVHVSVPDVVAYKGAAHVIGSLIRPPFAHPPPHHHEGHEGREHVASADEERHFWRFARSLSDKPKHGCRGKREDIWKQLLKH